IRSTSSPDSAAKSPRDSTSPARDPPPPSPSSSHSTHCNSTWTTSKRPANNTDEHLLTEFLEERRDAYWLEHLGVVACRELTVGPALCSRSSGAGLYRISRELSWEVARCATHKGPQNLVDSAGELHWFHERGCQLI